MPVFTLECPECGHRFKGMAMAHTAQPREWACSKCGGRRATPTPDSLPQPHPWEEGHAVGCRCCG